MDQVNLALATIGGLVLVLGLLSGRVRSAPLSIPMLALGVGVLLGPLLDVLHPFGLSSRAVVLEQGSRLTLALGLMVVAMRLPVAFLRRDWRAVSLLLGPGLVLMWLSTALLVYLIVGLPPWISLLVGAVVTPTDPVISSAVVTGTSAERYLPARLRHLISAESGMNDGLGYPFVVLPFLFLSRPPGAALAEWVVQVLIWQVLGSVVAGGVLGYAAGRLMRWARAAGSLEPTSFLAYTIALSLTALGVARLLGTDGLLAVFVAGIAFSTVGHTDGYERQEHVQEAVGQFFVLPIFALLGVAIPWRGWLGLGWGGLLLVVLVLLVRRMPALLLLDRLFGPFDSTKDALFAGWFGPIGVGALFYANLAQRRGGGEDVWVIGSLLICASIIVHGATAAPFIRLYASRSGQPASDARPEREAAGARRGR